MHAFLLCLLLGCSDGETRDKPTLASTQSCPEVLPKRMQRGMCYAHSYERGGQAGYGSDASKRSRRELLALGVDWLSITPFGFSRSLVDTDVRHIGDYRGGESDARVRAEIRAAKGEGLRVLLKPHIWLGTGEWIGQVRFDDPAAREQWHASYERWILHYAAIAKEEGVEILSIGTELGFVAENADRWRVTIARIRAAFPGKLVFGANWNEVERVPFWDALDYVGVQFYAPLETQNAAGDEAKRKIALERYLDGYGALAKKVNRPVLFTEVGYRAMRDTNIAPHTWPEHSRAAPDDAAQARAYTRFLDAVAGRDFVQGVYFWKWFTDPYSREEGSDGFSPRGKLAQKVLQAAFTGQCNPPLTRARPQAR